MPVGKVCGDWRGLVPASFKQAWERDTRERQGKQLLLHMRIATHGGVTLKNTHPFRVGRRNLWLMHNGIISQHARTGDTKSDTRRFAATMRSLINLICGASIVRLLGK